MAERISIPSNTPISDKNGVVSQEWRLWFNKMYNRSGGSTALSNNELDVLIKGNTASTITLSNRVTTSEQDIIGIKSTVDSNNQKITDLNTRVTNDEGTIVNLDSRVTVNELKIVDLGTNKEPLITKTTGYAKIVAGAWTFVNETYSLSTHLHTGTYEPANANIQTHISSTTNPHSTTAAQVGAEPLITKATGYGKIVAGAWTFVNETYLQTLGGILSGDLQILKTPTPTLRLTDTAATSTFRTTALINDTGHFRYQTHDSVGTFIANDYLIDKNASGAILQRLRIGNVDAFRLDSIALTAGVDNTLTLGSSAIRWNTIYSSSAVINTSDRNLKTEIADIEEQEKLVALKIKKLFKKFKYKEAVELKGENARIHTGLIAQDVRDAFIEYGLNPNKYAMFCEDTWYEIPTFETNDLGAEFHGVKVLQEYVDGAVERHRLSLRYEEIYAFLFSVM